MTPSIGFGIGLPVVQQVPAKVRAWEHAAGPAEIERVAIAADRLGYAHVACSDHVIVPRSYAPAMGAVWYDAVTTLAYLGGMTQLWSSDEPAYVGRTFAFRDVVLAPRPHRRPHPPLWIGGNTRRTVRRSVEHGDGWVPWQLSYDDLAALVAYGRELAESGRRERSWEVVAPFPPLDLLGRQVNVPADAMRLPAADVAGEIDRYRKLGVGRLHVSFVSESCDELLEQMEAFATQVAVLL